MSDQAMVRAVLKQIDWNEDGEAVESGPKVDVQFNPETLSVAYANQKAGEGQSGGSALQYVGQGTTKLTLDLWFDITGKLPKGKEDVKDVRKLTAEVVAFITPEEVEEGKWKAPGMRFHWGNFIFDGVVESISEKLEFFSEDGRALRAQMSLSLASQQIQFQLKDNAGPGGKTSKGAAGARTPGQKPLAAAQQGKPVQSMASKAPGGWQPVAAANGIENPRHVGTGQLIDLKAGTRR